MTLCLGSGCGSGPNLTPVSNVSSQSTLVGRVLTEGSGDGFTVSGFDEAGKLVFTAAPSLASGSFQFPSVTGLRRLVAYRHRSGSRPEFYATDRVVSDREVYLSPITTLASAYRDQHPKATSDQAEAAIRKLFALSPSFQPGISEQNRHSGVSLKRYRDYLDGEAAPADGPISFQSASHQAHLRLLERPVALGDGPDIGQFLLNLSQTEFTLGIQAAAGDPEGAAITLLSWSMGLLGLAFPSSDPTALALVQIQAQLTSIQNQINALSQQVTNEVQALANLVQQQAALTQYVSLESSIASQINTADAAQLLFNSTPPGASSQVATLVTTVTNPSFLSIPASIADAYGGSNDPNVPSMQALLKIMSAGRIAAPRFRQNSLGFDALYSQSQLYMTRQAQTTALATNGLHAQTPPNMQAAVILFNQLCDRISLQRSRLPLPLPSDNILLVRATGQICMKTLFPSNTYAATQAQLQKWNEGGLTGWRLADWNLLLDDNSPFYDGGIQPTPNSPTQAQVQAWLNDLGIDPQTLNQPFISYSGSNTNVYAYFQLGQADFVGGKAFDWPGQPNLTGYSWFCTHASQMAKNPSLFATVSNGPSSLTIFQTGLQVEASGTFTCPASDVGSPPQFPSVTVSADLTGNVTWSSSDTNVVTVSNVPGSVGRLTPQNQGGSAVISCSRVDDQGKLVTATKSVTVSAAPTPTLQQIQMSPRTATLTAGQLQQLYCTGLLSNLNAPDLSSQAQWSTSNPALGTVQTLPNGTAYLIISSTPSFGSLTVTCRVDSSTNTYTDSATFFILP
jgi:hypothetical protein